MPFFRFFNEEKAAIFTKRSLLQRSYNIFFHSFQGGFLCFVLFFKGEDQNIIIFLRKIYFFFANHCNFTNL